LPSLLVRREFFSQQKKSGKMLWVDRYRPKSLDALITNKDIGANLKNLVR
jgi:hypothetical protein